jgi:Holliday junction resolvase RusA-like endonuclease
MYKIKYPALSVNKVWQGKRFKTKTYKDYEIIISHLLKPLDIPEGKLQLVINFHVYSQLADLDNFLKPFIDILQKKYNFDDKRIYQIIATKYQAIKGSEFIEFQINSFDNN